ncbi:MAG: NAD(P)H-dependent oxidoreductase [Candidatus Syntropharchaeia archaeon]
MPLIFFSERRNCHAKSISCLPLDNLKEADGIIFGSPTYFGSVSGEMK